MLLCMALLALCVGCSSHAVYDARHEIDPVRGWASYDTLTYTVDLPAAGQYDVDLFLRHSNDYHYRNIWLFVESLAPDSALTTDTIECPLADNYGRWYGGGWGSYYQLQHRLRDNVPLDSGTYHVTVVQAMRDRMLTGITTIGLRVTPAGE